MARGCLWRIVISPEAGLDESQNRLTIASRNPVPRQNKKLCLARIKSALKMTNLRRGCVTCYMDEIQQGVLANDNQRRGGSLIE